MGSITEENQILIDLGSHVSKSNLNFIQQLLDAIPVGILVLSKDLAVYYMNRHLSLAIEYGPEAACA